MFKESVADETDTETPKTSAIGEVKSNKNKKTHSLCNIGRQHYNVTVITV